MGKVCYHCRRAWRVNYLAAFSLAKLIPHCTQNEPLFDAFSSLASFAVNKMAAAGSRGVMVQKSEFDATAEGSVLSQIKRASVMRDAEPDQIWPFSSAGGLAPPHSRCGLSTHGARRHRQCHSCRQQNRAQRRH